MKKKKFTFLVDENEIETFKRICKLLDTDAAKQLRQLIREFNKDQRKKLNERSLFES